jgi:antitoxin CptB
MDLLRKQILYRSTHRGCKETDFLIGEFAKNNLNEISDLELFSRFLEEDDLEIYDWILAKNLEPKHYKSIVERIREFHKVSAS